MTSSTQLSVVFLLSVALNCHAADAKPDPAQLIRSANEASDLSQILPHRLSGIVVLDPGAADESSGTITIYRDQDQYRSDIELSGQWRTWLKLGNKVYIADSSPMAFLGLEKLKDIESAWRERRLDDREIRFSHQARKKTLGEDVWCMDLEFRGFAPLNLCLDAKSPAMLSSGYGDDRYEFSDFQEFDGKHYPGKIRRLRRGKAVLELRELRATAGPLPENIFQVPTGAREFETCGNVVPPRGVSSGDTLPTALYRAESIRIFVYGIVTEDGSFTHVQVASVPRNPTVVKLVKEAMEKRRYSPAICGTKPVAIEHYIDIDTRRPILR